MDLAVIISGMLQKAWQGLVDILYPKKCLACKTKLGANAADDFICGPCWGKIKINPPPFCMRCGRQLKAKSFAKKICPDCIKHQLHFDRAWSPCQYDGVLKELIHEFKYKGKDYLGESLSILMIDFMREYNLPVKDMDAIVPVPLHKTRLREREFNQAQILASFISEKFNLELLDNQLTRHRLTKNQVDLGGSQRLTNVQGSFFCAETDKIKNKHILLVDDVLTTGNTCSEAAHTLKNAGAKIVFVLTLAS